MPAYAKTYLTDAMENLGEMADSVVTLFHIPLAQFWPLFSASSTAKTIASGSPFTIMGCSGLELAVRVCDQAGLLPCSQASSLAQNTKTQSESSYFATGFSQSYWCGWILGFYQWQTNLSFLEIERNLPMTTVERMYRTFHEESEERFCEAANEVMRPRFAENGLKRQRLALGLSQSQLARRSGVGLRAIQQYEQGTKNIAHASYGRIERLSQALHCEPRQLMNAASSFEYAIATY